MALAAAVFGSALEKCFYEKVFMKKFLCDGKGADRQAILKIGLIVSLHWQVLG